MNGLRTAWRFTRAWIFTGFLLAVTAYFTYFGLFSDRGYYYKQQRIAELEQAQKDLAELQQERQRLQARVDLMHPSHINPDMLDEQVRRQLGYVGENDIVLIAE